MSTKVILLQRMDNLGAMGDVVSVRPGYARNYLLPQKKALRATKDNITFFDKQRQALQADNDRKRQEAESKAASFKDVTVAVIRQASESGQLFGSVSSRDIADALTATGLVVERRMVDVNQAFKMIGLYPVMIALHPELKVKITLNIARSEEEAAIQQKTGKALVAEGSAPARARAAASAAAAMLDAEDAAADAADEADATLEPSAKAERRAARKAAKKSKDDGSADAAPASDGDQTPE